MKKFMSILLALVLILSMGMVAFAEDSSEEPDAPGGGAEEQPVTEWNGTYTATEATDFNEIEKTYNSENNVVVNETLSFASTASTGNPDGGSANLTVAELEVTSLNAGTLTVTIPSLTKAGTYEWTIKENTGGTAGVTYSAAEVHVIVLVEYDNDTHALKIAKTTSYIKKENGEKTKTFANTFNSGSFTVAKDVEGNMANENDKFEISVTLTSTKPICTNVTVAGDTVTPDQWTNNDGTYTYTYTTTYSEIGGAKTFSDIPVGVTVTVAENTATEMMNGYTYDSTKMDGKEFTSLTIADDTSSAIVVKNTKTTSIDTGITTDSLPYVMLLGLVALIGAAMLIKRRSYNN